MGVEDSETEPLYQDSRSLVSLTDGPGSDYKIILKGLTDEEDYTLSGDAIRNLIGIPLDQFPRNLERVNRDLAEGLRKNQLSLDYLGAVISQAYRAEEKRAMILRFNESVN